MAKVKDQIYDGSEEIYTDAAGVIHFFGELFRHIMPDSYPLPSLNPTGVTRKSPRGYKPSQQGPGSAAQRPWRECFVLCAERWDELPDECPEIPPCPPRSAKEMVWAAKQAQGVMCSYFDLYMDCCLSSCIEIEVSGPGGSSYKGGSIPDTDDCWPCVPPCLESTLSIGCTTTTMTPSETQELVAMDSLFGEEVPCCPTGDLSWEIISGSGMLEPDSGQRVVYTAPDVNENCQENATIKLTDCCGRTATLEIAINLITDDYPAYAIDQGECEIMCTASAPGYGQTCSSTARYTRAFYRCSGAYIEGADAYPWMTSVPTVLGDCSGESICMYALVQWCAENPHPFEIIDMRTDEQKLSGCCPSALF